MGRKLLRDYEAEAGGAGAFSFDLQSEWRLADPEWTTDIVPEIMDGKNIADFVDPDILQRLEELEREEELFEAKADLDESDDELDEADKEMLQAIRAEKSLRRQQGQMRRTRNATPITSVQRKKAHPNTVSDMAEHLRGRGMDRRSAEAVAGRAGERSRSRGRERERKGMKRGRDGMDIDDGDSLAMETRSQSRSQSRGPAGRPRSDSIARGRSLTPAPGEGFKNAKQKERAIKMGDQGQKNMAKRARKGEGDRHIPDLKPKHLYSGKMNKGTRDWR